MYCRYVHYLWSFCVRQTLSFAALKSLYNALIVPHLNYGVKLWYPSSNSVFVMQKRAIRVITSKKFFHHTSGLFKEHNLLKLPDLYKIHCLKLYFKIENNLCPNYIRSLLVHNYNIHDHNTRHRNDVQPTEIRSKWLRHSLPDLILETPDELIALARNSSLQTFSRRLSHFFIDSYEAICVKETCMVCGRRARD